MDSSKLNRIINLLLFVCVVPAISLSLSMNLFDSEIKFYYNFPFLISIVSIIGFILTILAIIMLQDINNFRTIVLKPEDIKPGTTIEVLSSDYLPFDSKYVYNITDEEEGDNFLLETSLPLMEGNEGWLIKVENGNFSPYTAYVNPEAGKSESK